MSWLEKRAESFVKDADPGTGTPYVSMWDAMELAREFAERAIRGMYEKSPNKHGVCDVAHGPQDFICYDNNEAAVDAKIAEIAAEAIAAAEKDE